jgi:hypothetical protein
MVVVVVAAVVAMVAAVVAAAPVAIASTVAIASMIAIPAMIAIPVTGHAHHAIAKTIRSAAAVRPAMKADATAAGRQRDCGRYLISE